MSPEFSNRRLEIPSAGIRGVSNRFKPLTMGHSSKCKYRLFLIMTKYADQSNMAPNSQDISVIE